MKGHTFMILGSGNKLRFLPGVAPWESYEMRDRKDQGFTKGQVEMARFLFNELLNYGLYNKSNFLLTSRVRRAHVESRLKIIIENNEW